MTPRRTTLVVGLAIAAAAALALTACGMPAGKQTTQERDVADVTSVRLLTSGTLTVEEGGTPSLTVTAGENVLGRLTSDVRDGVLVLGVDGSSLGAMTGSISYHLVVDRLDAVTVEGSGDVTADAATGTRLDVAVRGSGDVTVSGVDVRSVAVAIAGSGDVSLAGRADDQAVVIEGSGDYLAASLATRDATVSVEGSGDVDVDATGTLDVRIAGSGSVTHTGGAAVTSDVAGSGEVREG
ncbi:MAG: DUF2807 domain-containing protein [Cellulomonadaceae bacterium]|nr:DUF2807 domain-containing protein [Cellulomonadaceae bacterium]